MDSKGLASSDRTKWPPVSALWHDSEKVFGKSLPKKAQIYKVTELPSSSRYAYLSKFFKLRELTILTIHIAARSAVVETIFTFKLKSYYNCYIYDNA